jgi:hypothetical protein
MTIEIIRVESEYSLYCHYYCQTQRQECHIELDCANGILSAGYNSEIGTAIPNSVYHGHDQRFGIDLVRGSTVNRLMEKIVPLAERVVAGYESRWDGNNYVARFTDDAQEAIDAISERCMEEEGDIEVWDAWEWLDEVTSWDGTSSVEIEDVGKVTATTTDDELSEMEAKIDAMAEKEGVFLNDVDRMLEDLRAECEEEEG